jgi:hypothetical protein
MSTMIQATLDYKLFHRISSNREVDTKHLGRLKNSITKKNYLYLFPIIINKDMEIVDGQHRLMAAMELKLPIFYMIDDKITKADIAMVNSNRKTWGPKDYIKYFATDGNKVYVKLLDIISKYPIGTSAAVTILSDNCGSNSTGGGSASIMLKTGEINDNHHELAKAILVFCASLKNCEYSFKREFIIPLKDLILLTDLTTPQLFSKVKDRIQPDIESMRSVFMDLKRKHYKRDVNKIEPIPPPVRKDVFKGKETLTAKDFNKYTF